jgi:hypothetical protein
VGLGAGWILKPAGTGSPTAAAAIGGVDASAGFDAGDREADESIAVLAFADLSPEGDQGYFADGIAEEILNALVRIEGLRVAGRTSSFHFKGRNEDLRTIGATLGVATSSRGPCGSRQTGCASPRSSSAATTASTSGRRRTTAT